MWSFLSWPCLHVPASHPLLPCLRLFLLLSPFLPLLTPPTSTSGHAKSQEDWLQDFAFKIVSPIFYFSHAIITPFLCSLYSKLVIRVVYAHLHLLHHLLNLLLPIGFHLHPLRCFGSKCPDDHSLDTQSVVLLRSHLPSASSIIWLMGMSPLEALAPLGLQDTECFQVSFSFEDGSFSSHTSLHVGACQPLSSATFLFLHSLPGTDILNFFLRGPLYDLKIIEEARELLFMSCRCCYLYTGN